MTRALVIINEHSRSGAEQRQRVVELLEAAGIDTLAPTITRAEDIGARIEAHRGEVEAVVIGGGDGTLQCAAAALARTGLRLGVVPLGTANDLARTLGIPADIEAACRIIAAGHHRRIDLGSVNGRPFFNVANIGLGVQVKRSLSPKAKRWWGAFSYVHAALDAYRRQGPFQAVIAADGRMVSRPAIQIAVGNGRYYGGGMAVHEDASISDGLLDLYAIRPQPLLRLVGMGRLLRRGSTDPLKGVLALKARSISVSTSHPMEITADGEAIGMTPARFGVLPGALDVYIARQEEGNAPCS